MTTRVGGARGLARSDVWGTLPEGVRLRVLDSHADDRGALTELFRQEWKGGDPILQWNLVESEAGVQRGVHVHLGYDEAYLLLEGRLTVGMRDTRPGSPTEGAVAGLELSGRDRRLAMVPTGIAHGLLFRERSTFLVGTTATWNPANELGCHWLDPALAIPWGTRVARLSARDAAFPPLAAIAGGIPAWRPR
jgi:dTDP-4-dehydrorhamnose 3,5-epimerase